jgi:hypothetical protein
MNGKATRTIREQRARVISPEQRRQIYPQRRNRLTFIHERGLILFKPFAMKEKVTEQPPFYLL